MIEVLFAIEAAAVTAVQTGQMGAKPVRFVADRPLYSRLLKKVQILSFFERR